MVKHACVNLGELGRPSWANWAPIVGGVTALPTDRERRRTGRSARKPNRVSCTSTVRNEVSTGRGEDVVACPGVVMGSGA
jgi:hypothetical protein